MLFRGWLGWGPLPCINWPAQGSNADPFALKVTPALQAPIRHQGAVVTHAGRGREGGCAACPAKPAGSAQSAAAIATPTQMERPRTPLESPRWPCYSRR